MRTLPGLASLRTSTASMRGQPEDRATARLLAEEQVRGGGSGAASITGSYEAPDSRTRPQRHAALICLTGFRAPPARSPLWHCGQQRSCSRLPRRTHSLGEAGKAIAELTSFFLLLLTHARVSRSDCRLGPQCSLPRRLRTHPHPDAPSASRSGIGGFLRRLRH